MNEIIQKLERENKKLKQQVRNLVQVVREKELLIAMYEKDLSETQVTIKQINEAVKELR